MEKVEKITTDIKTPNKNIDVLEKHFSHCFDKSGNFDFEKFKQELSENDIDFYKESYGLDWLGKSYARLLASDEATTLLKEDEAFNQKKENTNSENLLIKGDNLEVLKHLSHAYYEKVKMIYIDPPYNTGNDGFVYKDNRKFTVSELKELAGIDEEKAKRIIDFTQSNSNSHSAWLTFMYPRLYIAKQFLNDDGIIFVSIDDNELSQLKQLMDEIFGDENFLAQLNIITGANQSGEGVKIQKNVEYCLVYSKKNGSDCIIRVDKVNESYRNLNDAPTPLETREEMGYTIYYSPKTKKIIPLHDYDKSKIKTNDIKQVYTDNKDLISKGFIPIRPGVKNNKLHRWRWGIDSFIERIDEIVIFEEDEGYSAKFKQEGLNPPKNYHNYSVGTSELKDLFDGVQVFDYPKGTKYIKYLVSIGSQKNDLILDFFAGSGTTADAVMQLNSEDFSNRKYILVQLPEDIDAEENETSYDFIKNKLNVDEPTIFEITKERLIRSSKKIQLETISSRIAEKEEEIKEFEGKQNLDSNNEKIIQLKSEIENLNNQDLGFRIYETIPIWEDYGYEAEELDEQKNLFDESKLTNEDIKALLVTWKTYDGILLTEDLVEIDLGGYSGYYVNNRLYLMNKNFSTNNLKALLEKIDTDKDFNPTSIIAFGYHFESKNLREIAENIKTYANKKHIDIEFITRY